MATIKTTTRQRALTQARTPSVAKVRAKILIKGPQGFVRSWGADVTAGNGDHYERHAPTLGELLDDLKQEFGNG